MNEETEFWRAHRHAQQDKRAANRDHSTKALTEAGIGFESRNGGAHLIMASPDGLVDFWPGTGKWIVRSTRKAGRGFANLLWMVRP